jgi:serine/threonine-protein kinase
MIGSLNYMSPEQMLGRAVDLRSDIFAVGAVAYELLCYQQAFPGTLDNGLLQRLPQEPPPSLSSLCAELPEEIERIVMRALAKRPDDRFADLEQMRIALREVRRTINPEEQLEALAAVTLRRPSPSSATGRTPAQKSPTFTRGRIATAGGVLAAAGIGAAIWIAPRGDRVPTALTSPAPAATIVVATPVPASVPMRPIVPAPAAATAPAVAPTPLAAAPIAALIPAPPRASVVRSAPVAPASTVAERASAETLAAAVTTPVPPAAAPPIPPALVDTPPPAPIVAEAPRASAIVAPPAAAPVVAAVEGPVERERPGILQALNRYQSAYRDRNVKSLLAVYPSLPRESRQALERAFSRDCRDYDVTFGNLQLALNADDPTYATVTVRSVYTCQPKTAQAAQPQAVQDVFVMRKLGDGWLIDSIGTMNAGKK